jgi:hypothetical protein
VYARVGPAGVNRHRNARRVTLWISCAAYLPSVDPELQKIAASAAAALVSSMATDGWKQAKEAYARLCGRDSPDLAALESDRHQVGAGDQQAETDVRAYWSLHLRRLAEERPDIAAGLGELLRELGPAAPERSGQVYTTYAGGSAQVNIAGRDQRIGRR